MANQIMNTTEQLAEFIVGFNYQQIPSPVLVQARRCVVDQIGCALGARRMEMARTLFNFARYQGGPAEASLLGENHQVGVAIASWANSSLANLLDMDDTFAGFAHIGNAVITPAIATGEMVGASGRELITAIVVGYEVAARIGLALWPSPEVEMLYGIQPTWKVFGTVAAASKLLKLSKDQIVQAFGLAGTCAPLPMTRLKGDQFPRGWYKNGHGWGAHTGIFWTLLAREGLLGANTILDGEGGFWRIAGSDRCDFSKMIEGLGASYHLLGLEFKPYPACRWSHSAIDAFQAILTEHSLGEADLEEIQIDCFKGKELSNSQPRDMMDAQFSIPHVMAMVALKKPANVDWLSPEGFSNPSVRAISAKVKVQTDPEAERLFAESQGKILSSKVRVKTKNGRVFDRQVLYPKGTPGQNPFTDEDLMNKFISLATDVLPQPAHKEILDILYHVDDVERVTQLTAVLASRCRQ